MLNKDGGIETDLTVICLDKDYFRIVSSAATRERDKFHITKNLNNHINLIDVTDEYCVFGIFGPKSRELIKTFTEEDISNDKFKFATGKNLKINGCDVWVQRLSYVGELGYELYIKSKDSKEIYNLIVNNGKKYKISNCGAHAMDIMRMERGFVHWGHDISPEENQYQAGLSFTINYKKNVEFIGKENLLKIKEKGIEKRLMMFVLENNNVGEPLLLHDEPIFDGNKIIGRTTSGNYSFNFSKNLSFGYVNSGNTKDDLKKKEIFIEVEKKRYKAKVLEKPLNTQDFKNI